MNKYYILNIKGVMIYEDEWDDTRIIIQRNGDEDDLEFNKDDIIETVEENE